MGDVGWMLAVGRCRHLTRRKRHAMAAEGEVLHAG